MERPCPGWGCGDPHVRLHPRPWGTGVRAASDQAVALDGRGRGSRCPSRAFGRRRPLLRTCLLYTSPSPRD
eukprot:12758248-Alexandrium_andersonii.AAC.1